MRTCTSSNAAGAEHVLILSGDHIYRMDYAAMLRHHHDAGADATVACLTIVKDESPVVGDWY
jgi:glucose-1-phosphate adenylyltransferase